MCCLFGFIDYNHNLSGKQKNRLLRSLASAADERGTDAAGIAYHAGGKLNIMKKAKPAHVLRFRVPAETTVVTGHTRTATQGDAKKAYNAHPFQGQIGNKKFALAHNGVLLNDRLLQRSKNLPKTHIGTDSYIAVQLLETQKCPELQQPPKGGRTSSGHFCVYGLRCAGQCLIEQESLLLDKTAFVAY